MDYDSSDDNVEDVYFDNMMERHLEEQRRENINPFFHDFYSYGREHSFVDDYLGRENDIRRWLEYLKQGHFADVINATRYIIMSRSEMDKRLGEINDMGIIPCSRWDFRLFQGFDHPHLIELRELHDLCMIEKARADEEENARLKPYKSYIMTNHPVEPIEVTFRFTGFETGKPREKKVSIRFETFIDKWIRIPFIQNLLDAVCSVDQETVEALCFYFFPVMIILADPVTPKAIDAFVDAVEKGYLPSDAPILVATVAECLGDYTFGRDLFMECDLNIFSADSIRSMSRSMKDSFIMWYLSFCFNIKKITKNYLTRPKNQDTIGLIKLTKEEIDNTASGFRRRMMDFVSKKPDVAKYIFNNHRDIIMAHIKIPDRHMNRFKRVNTFSDLLNFVDFINNTANKKKCDGSEIMRLAKRAPHIQKLYAELEKYQTRNRRRDWCDEDIHLNPQEREDSLYKQIADAERAFVKEYNASRTQKAPKDLTLLAKSACSSSTSLTPRKRK